LTSHQIFKENINHKDEKSHSFGKCVNLIKGKGVSIKSRESCFWITVIVIVFVLWPILDLTSVVKYFLLRKTVNVLSRAYYQISWKYNRQTNISSY
jgi:nitrate reductase NapE component